MFYEYLNFTSEERVAVRNVKSLAPNHWDNSWRN